jgi:hypothetical protein
MSSSFSSAGIFFRLGEPVVPRSDSRMCKVGSENWGANGCFRADAKKVNRASPQEWTGTNIKPIDSLIPQAA